MVLQTRLMIHETGFLIAFSKENCLPEKWTQLCVVLVEFLEFCERAGGADFDTGEQISQATDTPGKTAIF